jgi:aspartate racemase
MAASFERLRAAGADFGLIATNTMHFVFDEVQQAAGLGSVGLLGTMFTMRERFFLGQLRRGEIRPESHRIFLDAIAQLRDRGAQGIILGCTEIPLLVKPWDRELPLSNTAVLHAEKALNLAAGV